MANVLSSLNYEVSDTNVFLGQVKWETMRDAIYDFFGNENTKPTDTLLFYYSGHGVPDNDQDVFLATSDIDPNIPSKRGFNFNELTKMIRECISTSVVAILDCCYSGSARISKGHEDDAARLGHSTIDRQSEELAIRGEGKCILAASQAQGEAYVLEEENHSLFTYYLLQALRGQALEAIDNSGYVTVDSLSKYVYNTIMSLPPAKRPKQKPIRKLEASGDIVLAYYPEFRTKESRKIAETEHEIEKELEHINHALRARTHSPMYSMHKYWARKPANIVSEYIKRYSKEGDTVLDPFCGSGVSIIEALRLGRNAIGVDLDPVSIYITRMTGATIDLDKLRKSFDGLREEVKPKIDILYRTKCAICEKPAEIEHIIFKDSEPAQIHFKCPHCNTTSDKIFTLSDKRLALKIKQMNIPYWYPRDELIWNTRVNIKRGMKVSDLFSKRNLIALSIIYNYIDKIKDSNIRNILKFAFSASLPQASKLLVHTPGSGPSWKIRGYWIPPNRYEMNVWNFFENRYKKILNGKKESNSLLGSRFKEGKDVTLHNRTALDLSVIEDESVDYIFTDPPYGDSVPYLELNYMWALWLKFKVKFEDEIIISDSPLRQDKNQAMYSKMMNRAFREMHRVLKPDHWMTVTFNNTNFQIYNIIIKAAIIAGFDLERIVYQLGAVVSAKANLAPYGSAKGDYYIRFKKPKSVRILKGEMEIDKEIDRQTYERIIIETVKEIIAERGEPTPYSIIVQSYSHIYDKLKDHGFLFSAPEKIEDILKNSLNKDFILIENRWWFKDPARYHLDKAPLRERVEEAVIDVLNNKIKVEFDDIFRELVEQFSNALTPESGEITDVLENYAKRVNGKWMLKSSVRSRVSQHSKFVEMVARLGVKAGFKVYADLEGWKEQGLPFDLDENKLKRVSKIDVVWHENGKALYEFEVENSTSISEAIIRGSHISDPRIKRFIVIPEERENLLVRKINEPMLSERIKKDNWNFIRYNDLEGFYIENKNVEIIKPVQIEALAKMPISKAKERQSHFDEYHLK